MGALSLSPAWRLRSAKITPRTKAIEVVHLYGSPTDMDPVLVVARARGIAVVEDAAEAHGAEYKGRRVGSLGDLASFSFFGNKIITTGEGGMVVTNDAGLAARCRHLRGQGVSATRTYWHDVVGFNYRMTNVAAAIGCAQLERVGNGTRILCSASDTALPRRHRIVVPCSLRARSSASSEGERPNLP